MSNPPRAAGDDGNNNDVEKTMAKTAGFVVFSGIAMSILKALNPFNSPNQSSSPKLDPLNEPIRTEKALIKPLPPPSRLPPLREKHSQRNPSVEENVVKEMEQNVVESTSKTIEIVKGDTLWGLSREHGVSIGAIKEANKLTGDTIYAGKKLIIPN